MANPINEPSGVVFHDPSDTFEALLMDLWLLAAERTPRLLFIDYGYEWPFRKPPQLPRGTLRGVSLRDLAGPAYAVPLTLDAAIGYWDELSALPRRTVTKASIKAAPILQTLGLGLDRKAAPRLLLARALLVIAASHGRLQVTDNSMILTIDGIRIGLRGGDILGHRVKLRVLGEVEWPTLFSQLSRAPQLLRRGSTETTAVYVTLAHHLPELANELYMLFCLIVWGRADEAVAKVFKVDKARRLPHTQREALARMLRLVDSSFMIPIEELREYLEPRMGKRAFRMHVYQNGARRYTEPARSHHRNLLLTYGAYSDEARHQAQRLSEFVSLQSKLKGIS